MKKNIYGNIEDIVVRVRMVTPKGTVERNFLVSSGHVRCGPCMRASMLHIVAKLCNTMVILYACK